MSTSVIEHPTYFTSLPRDYYCSREILEQEQERVFRRQWLYFCHISELGHRGAYLSRDILGENIVAVRDGAGEIHAFFNVCRHRGYRVCPLGSGRLDRFVCDYHRWSYALDGSLLGAPAMPDGTFFDYKDWGLHRVHVDVWRGFVFVALGDDRPEDLARSASGILEADRLSLVEPEHVKQVHVVVHEFACNWKILMENYLECYHCRSTHPEVCRISDLDQQYARPISSARELFGLAVPLNAGVKTFSTSGDIVCTRLLGEFGRMAEIPDGFGAGFVIQPALTAVLFHVDYGLIHEIRPLGTDRVQFTNRWFVHEAAQEGTDYELESLIDLWEITNRQDQERCEGVQRGVQSRSFVPGPNSLAREQQIRSALLTYLEMMERPL
jgi:phenylpropionate dioxygenase-like ring-hydroxylating dioxygenase large terminal subunit